MKHSKSTIMLSAKELFLKGRGTETSLLVKKVKNVIFDKSDNTPVVGDFSILSDNDVQIALTEKQSVHCDDIKDLVDLMNKDLHNKYLRTDQFLTWFPLFRALGTYSPSSVKHLPENEKTMLFLYAFTEKHNRIILCKMLDDSGNQQDVVSYHRHEILTATT